jgi:carboxypeptidase Q
MPSAAARIKKSIWMAVVLGLLPYVSMARAQNRSADDRLEEIEKQIQALRKLVGEMRADGHAGIASSAAGASATAALPSASLPVGLRARDRDAVDPMIAKIRDEGLNHSQVMSTLDYLTNVIGQRLTGSPNAKRANDWTRGKLEGWGLVNAHLEPWGPFGRGWSLKRFSLQVIKPQTIPVIACPKAWTPGFDKPFEADVVWIDAKTDADLDKYKGKLKGAVVLAGPVRPLKPHFEAPGVRMTEADLLVYANSTGRRVPPAVQPPKGTSSTEFSLAAIATANSAASNGAAANGASASSTSAKSPTSATDSGRNSPPNGASPSPDDPTARAGGDQSATAAADRAARRGESPVARRLLAFCAKEEAALVLTASPQGDGGTVFVASASIPGADGRVRGGPRPWSEDAPPMPAQVCVAVEDYNRLVRMVQQGEDLKMAVDLEVQFLPTDMASNTIAEITGDDLKDEVVMVGGHLDSWHAGTGATDNGAGVAVAMEAVRILKAAGVKPRRTIRVGLWTGEEQGLLGSQAYVTKHFGTAAGGAERGRGRVSRDQTDTKPDEKKDAAKTDQPAADAKPSPAVRLPEHDKLSIYFNLDNGAGRIRGVFTQGNEAAVPLFRKWLIPFHDLGADTVSLANTGSTDHISFEAVGLPGFEFMQDPIEYMSRSHHSNEDVFDRIPEDDLKEAAVIMAAFTYNAAMMDQRFPRKAAE